jgi:hypothetical protein
MNKNIERLCKEADLRLQVQMIEGYCKTIAFVTDGTHDVNEDIVKIIHENSKKILEGVKTYYTIEEEIKNMK